MGRRSKNKQADPAPLAEKNGISREDGTMSSKKLGKRKATDPDVESKRPVKKVKAPSGKTERGARGGKADKQKAKKAKAGKKDGVAWDGEGNDTDGWEDVEDDGNLQAETRCVLRDF